MTAILELAESLRRERESAVELIDAIRRDPKGIWDRELRETAFTPGTAQALCDAARSEIGSDLTLALTFAQFAVLVANQLDPQAHPRPLVAQVRGTAFKDLSTVHRTRAEYRQAHRALDAADREVIDEPSLSYDRAVLQLARGLVYAEEQDYEPALSLFSAAEDMFREYEDPVRLGQVLHGRAGVEYRLARFREAESSTRAALALAREQDNLHQVTSLLNNLGHILVASEMWNDAAAVLHEALTLSQHLGLRVERTSIEWALARLRQARGEGNAAAMFAGVAERFRELQMPDEQGLAMLDAAEAHLRDGDSASARLAVKASLGAFEHARLPKRLATALAYLKDIADSESLSAPAIRQVRAYLETKPLELFAPSR